MVEMKKHISTFLSTVAMLCLFLNCSTQSTKIKTEAPSPASSLQKLAPYIIQPGDQLDIKFFYNPELNESITVRPDGIISLQLIDEVQAAGLSPFQLDEFLTQAYSKELRKPMVTVIMRSFSSQRIYVGGEVNRQGLVNLSHQMTPIQAIFKAGGFKETAKPKETIIIRKGPDRRPFPIRIDLDFAMRGKGGGFNFVLQPDDIVYVPKSAIAKANKFVSQYIEQLILFRGTSFGITYEIDKFEP
jgi:protein involved in polysaccharide export with SLBB domain